MNYFLIFGAAVILLAIFTRMRNRRGKPSKQLAEGGPRVQGFQVTAFLHPRMSSRCLFDDGVQFGPGFRRKEGPQLPHDGECRCQTLPFSFPANEVFKGALRKHTENQSTVPMFPALEVSRLIGNLKKVEGEGVPSSEEDYVSRADLSSFPASFRHDIQLFLENRYEFLSAPGKKQELAPPVTAPDTGTETGPVSGPEPLADPLPQTDHSDQASK